MKMMNMLVGTMSLACLALLAGAVNTGAQTTATDATQKQEAGQNKKKNIVLPAVFFETGKSNKSISAQEMSPAEALQRAFLKGKTPTKADLLDYSIGLYIPSDEEYDKSTVLMYGFEKRPENMPGNLFAKETYVKFLYYNFEFRDNVTAMDLETYDNDFAHRSAYGPTTFSNEGAITLDRYSEPSERETWHFRVYEKHLIFKVTQDKHLIAIGYFYKKVR